MVAASLVNIAFIQDDGSCQIVDRSPGSGYPGADEQRRKTACQAGIDGSAVEEDVQKAGGEAEPLHDGRRADDQNTRAEKEGRGHAHPEISAEDHI